MAKTFIPWLRYSVESDQEEIKNEPVSENTEESEQEKIKKAAAKNSLRKLKSK